MSQLVRKLSMLKKKKKVSYITEMNLDGLDTVIGTKTEF